jgi:hypothetical protein
MLEGRFTTVSTSASEPWLRLHWKSSSLKTAPLGNVIVLYWRQFLGFSLVTLFNLRTEQKSA